VNHCAHGGSVTVQQILDWSPFTSFTTRDEPDDADFVLTNTTVFTPDGGDTNVTSYFLCEPEVAWPQVRAQLSEAFESGHRRLAGLLATHADPK
jgi:hypothetical protein